jgi:molybdopterin converting factor small subunit
MILCNEVDIGVTGGLNTILKDGDILTILPLVHGG